MNNDVVDLELRERWIKTLEEGTYKQGQIFLRSCDDKFCCLGVLADMVGVEWKVHQSVSDVDTYFYRSKDENDLDAFIDSNLTCKVGIDLYAGTLASMNDGGASFKEIAQFIREEGVRNG